MISFLEAPVDRNSFMNIDVLDFAADYQDYFNDPVDYSRLDKSKVDRIIRKRVSKEQKKTSVIFKVHSQSME